MKQLNLLIYSIFMDLYNSLFSSVNRKVVHFVAWHLGNCLTSVVLFIINEKVLYCLLYDHVIHADHTDQLVVSERFSVLPLTTWGPSLLVWVAVSSGATRLILHCLRPPLKSLL